MLPSAITSSRCTDGRRTTSGSRACGPGANVTPRSRTGFATRAVDRRDTRSSSRARSTTRLSSSRWASWSKRGSARSRCTCITTATRDRRLQDKLEQTITDLAGHGVVSAAVGRPAWAFIHGNWALANGRPDGRWCGVDDELALLHELGCYADFTFPERARPVPAVDRQPHLLPTRRRAPARLRLHGSPPRGRTRGPLACCSCKGLWRSRAASPTEGVGLRLETGALDAGDPADRGSTQDVDRPVRPRRRAAGVDVREAAHPRSSGAEREHSARRPPMEAFHEALATLASRGPWRVHYVTAREMYNVARAAMDGMARLARRVLRLRGRPVGSRASRADVNLRPGGGRRPDGRR